MSNQKISWKDLEKVYLPPPPEVVQRSPLYTVLPESRLQYDLESAMRTGVLQFQSGFTPMDARRLPSRFARDHIRIRPRSAAPATATSSVAATSYMLRQSKEVAAFRKAHQELQSQMAEEREKRWAALRDTTRRQEEMRAHENTKKRQLRLARQVAAQQLRDQHEDERLLCSIDEHRGRATVERHEISNRRDLAFGLWRDVVGFHFASAMQRLIGQEDLGRELLCEDFVSELEVKERQFIARAQVLCKTGILAQEKSLRIALLKVVNVRLQFKAQQDAEINVALTAERKARQKLYDEEGYRFMDIDGEKYALLQELYREARRKQEERLQRQREHDQKLLNERRDFERVETDVRNQAARLEEANARAALRNLYVVEKRAAHEKARKRTEREALEWQRERQRQLQPIIKEEETFRAEVADSEVSTRRELAAMHSQLLADIMVPLAVNIGEGTPCFRFCGPAVPLWTSINFKRKQFTTCANLPITQLTLSITAVEGRTSGDDVDILAAEVMSTKDRRLGLRNLDGTILDEDGSALCTIERSTINIEELPSPEAIDESFEMQIENNEPVLQLRFTNIDKDALAKTVERCAQALVFKVHSTNNSIESRRFNLIVAFSCSTEKKLGDSSQRPARTPRSKAHSMPSAVRRHSAVRLHPISMSKPDAGFFKVVRSFAINVAPPLVSLSLPNRVSANRGFLICDVRKRPEGSGKQQLFVPLFSAPVVTSDSSRDFAGCVVRVRFTEGYTAEDQLQFASGDLFLLKRDEIRSEGIIVAKMTGKLLPAAASSTREVTIHFVEDRPFPAASLEKFLLRLNYANFATNPPPHRRTIEVLVLDGKKPNAVASTIRIEVNIVGCAEQSVSIATEENSVTILRDAEVVTPPHLRNLIGASSCALFPSAVVDVAPALAARDALPGGSLTACVSSHAFAWDEVFFKPPPSVGGSMAEVRGKKREEMKLVWYPNSSDFSTSITIGTVQRFLHADGKLKPGIHVDFAECQVSVLQALVRSLALRTKGTAETIGVTKTISVEVCVTDWQQPTTAGRTVRQNGPSASANCPTIFGTTVQLLPSNVVAPAVPIVLGRSPNAVPFEKIALDPSSMDDIFDGGMMKVEIVGGKSGMEVLSILPLVPSSDEKVLQEPSNEAALTAKDEQQPRELGESDDAETSKVDEPTDTLTVSPDPNDATQMQLMKGQVVCGTITESADCKLVVRFAGRQRQEAKNDYKSGFQKLPVLAPGKWVSFVLSRLSIQIAEEDSLLLKTLIVTLEDSYGCESQFPFQIDVAPIHLPSRFMNPPTGPIFYRANSVNLVSPDDSIYILASSWVEDDDTQACGKGVLVIEPHQGITDDDVLTWIPSPAPQSAEHDAWNDLEQKRLAFHTYSADPMKMSISCDGKDIALSIEEKLSNGGNRFSVTIFADTPITVCSLILQHIGFFHREKFPSRCHERQYSLIFNAGDEDVPDTRAKIRIQVGPPLLHTLPLYETVTYRDGGGKSFLFPHLICGCKGTVPIKSDTITFCCFDARGNEDEFQLCFDDDVWVEKNVLLCSLDVARYLLGGVVIPSKGYMGVVIGQLRPLEEEGTAGFTLQMDTNCILNASAIPGLMGKLYYNNTSLSPFAGARHCQLKWRRAETGEMGQLKVRCQVEVLGSMTLIQWSTPAVSCYEQEDVFCCRGAQLINEDAPLFERGTSMVGEIVGAEGEYSISLPAKNPQSPISVEGSSVFVKGHFVGELDPLATTKKLIVNFADCPMSTAEILLQNLVFRGIGQSTCVLQITLRAEIESRPSTLSAVQINVFRRPFDFGDCTRHEYVIGSAAPILVFERLSIRPSADLAGATVSVALSSTNGSGERGKPVQVGVDRLILRALPDHLVLNKGVITNRSSSTPIALFSEKSDGTGIVINFPKGAKYSKIAAMQDILSSIAFESVVDISPKKSAASATKKPGRAISEDPQVATATTAAEQGTLFCALTATVQLDSGESIEAIDCATISIV